MRNEAFIERGKTDCWIWQQDQAKAPNLGALMACRNEQCCNPRHLVKAPNEVDASEESEPAPVKLARDSIMGGDKDAIEAYARGLRPRTPRHRTGQAQRVQYAVENRAGSRGPKKGAKGKL